MSGREYISRDSKAPKRSTALLGIVAGGWFILFGLIRSSVYYAVIGLILMLALSMRKKIAMDEEGLSTTYDVLFLHRRELWRYEDITDIYKDPSKDGKEMGLHVVKGVMAKRLIYPLHMYSDVIELAIEKNPDIQVEYAEK